MVWHQFPKQLLKHATVEYIPIEVHHATTFRLSDGLESSEPAIYPCCTRDDLSQVIARTVAVAHASSTEASALNDTVSNMHFDFDRNVVIVTVGLDLQSSAAYRAYDNILVATRAPDTLSVYYHRKTIFYKASVVFKAYSADGEILAQSSLNL